MVDYLKEVVGGTMIVLGSKNGRVALGGLK